MPRASFPLFALALGFLVSLPGCRKSDTTSAPTVATWSPPAFGLIEVYINQHTRSATQGGVLRPTFSPAAVSLSTSTNEAGKPPYSAKVTFLGTNENADQYRLDYSYPADGSILNASANIEFRGGDHEVFRDPEYRIGLRAAAKRD